MRVYLQPPQPSRGLERIATALRRYAPSTVEVLSFPRNADLTVIYTIGRRDAVWRQVADILSRGKKYAVVQVCLRSTMTPRTDDWLEIWRSAEIVWSYYNLQRAIAMDATNNDDGSVTHDIQYQVFANFYHAPLGVDGSVFYPRDRDSHCSYIVVSSGLSRLSESVRECWLAAEQVDRDYLHIGMKHGPFGGRPDFINDVTDDYLAEHLSDTEFVSGLRRKEGFELPAAEGLLCGARPICFDNEDWRWNYKNWAIYINEGSRQDVVDQLVNIFKQGPLPVTAAEREEAAHWFNWERIVGEFWQRCLQ